MSNKTEHALEHGEHAEHAAHDPFDRRVTMTIAITAALLACATMLGHRAHTGTLALQMEATEQFTKGANKWNHFQAKKNRQYLYDITAEQSGMLVNQPGLPKENASEWKNAVGTSIANWKRRVKKYEDESGELQAKAEAFDAEGEKLREQSKHVHHLGDQYDIAELGIEMGLVLCSLAVLTKKKGFWYTGMGFSGVGAAIMLFTVYQQYIAHGGH